MTAPQPPKPPADVKKPGKGCAIAMVVIVLLVIGFFVDLISGDELDGAATYAGPVVETTEPAPDPCRT